MRPIIICNKCKKSKQHKAFGICEACYIKHIRKKRESYKIWLDKYTRTYRYNLYITDKNYRNKILKQNQKYYKKNKEKILKRCNKRYSQDKEYKKYVLLKSKIYYKTNIDINITNYRKNKMELEKWIKNLE